MQPFFEQLTKSRVLNLSPNTEGIICSLCSGPPSRARSTKRSPCCLHLLTLPGESRPIQLQLNKYCRAATQPVASDLKGIKSTQSADAVRCVLKGFCYPRARCQPSQRFRFPRSSRFPSKRRGEQVVSTWARSGG